MRRLFSILLAAPALLWVSAAPAGDPEVPERYSTVDEVKALLDAKKSVTFVDVRVKEQYEQLHIRRARNIPLRELPARLREVPKRGLVVLY